MTTAVIEKFDVTERDDIFKGKFDVEIVILKNQQDLKKVIENEVIGDDAFIDQDEEKLTVKLYAVSYNHILLLKLLLQLQTISKIEIRPNIEVIIS